MTYQDTARPGREADSFDVVGSVRSLAEAVRHHKLMVAACVATTLAITTLYVFVWPPIYQSEAMVAAARAAHGPIDILIVNAGAAESAPLAAGACVSCAGAMANVVSATTKLAAKTVNFLNIRITPSPL